MPETTIRTTHPHSIANLPAHSPSLISIKRRSYDPSLSYREQLYPTPGSPEQAPNQRKLRRSSSSQHLYPSMLTVLEHEIQRTQSTSPTLPSTSSRSSSCDSDSVTASLASIKSSTLNIFDTFQDALVRAERAEIQAKANKLKWRTAVSELDRLRDENLLVRHHYENSQAECHRLRDLLEQQSSLSTSTINEFPSVCSNSSKKNYLMYKLGRKARSMSNSIMQKILHVVIKF
ncbi:hypothetical protein BGW37DRAFT_499252 [Umbelopsis sp. PMI_123]|nr:hypothetical protein BGW37DRAFT_499252 [Umbelopsis sp. PMI_123]